MKCETRTLEQKRIPKFNEFLQNLKGLYSLSEIDAEQLITASTPVDAVYGFSNHDFTKSPIGLILYTRNDPNIIVHRTRLGLLFPSLRYITVEDTLTLRPSKKRFFFGYFYIVFLIVGALACIGLVFQEPTQKPLTFVLALLFWVFTVLIFWLGTKIERWLITWGIKKHIKCI